jgi:predicted GH43/DUF377 family glycosyl hydrolase
MSSNWIKVGLIFKPDTRLSWMKTHAWVPTPIQLNGNIFRIFFSGRNHENLSQTGFFDFDIISKKIVNTSSEPVLKLGSLGLFDDSLAIGCSIVDHEDHLYMYYVGWTQTKKTRYLPQIGLAVSNDNGASFNKYSLAPIIPRQNSDPYGMASPFVLKVGAKWRMWYASYRKWELRDGASWPKYEIRTALSEDGINWTLNDATCLGSESEEAVARPWVVFDNNLFKMWYAYRKNYETYRIGYAESKDGVTWSRLDNSVGIDVSPNGFDSEMLEYPSVIRFNDSEYMFYNGNEFGLKGIGLAFRPIT